MGDPERPGMYRYWDGAQWTENRSPKPQSGPPAAVPNVVDEDGRNKRKRVALVVVALFVALSALGYVASLFFGATDDTGSSIPSLRPQEVCEDVRYIVEGTADSVSITVVVPGGATEQRDSVSVPYRNATGCFTPGQFTYISAQNDGETGTVGCRIERDGVTVAEESLGGAFVIAYCSD